MPRIPRIGRRPQLLIPVVAMADIVLLLVAFFALTASLEADSVLTDLPRTFAREEVPPGATYVSVTADGGIRVSRGTETPVAVAGAEELARLAAGILSDDPGRVFAIEAAATTRCQVIDRLLMALRQSGVRTIYVLSDQRFVDEEA